MLTELISNMYSLPRSNEVNICGSMSTDKSGLKMLNAYMVYLSPAAALFPIVYACI